jgi:large subunit ribosomal protein L6
MSKIGRKPIPFTSARVAVNGNMVSIDGPKVSFVHELPEEVRIAIKDKTIVLDVVDRMDRKHKVKWGLHRALLANKVQGVEKGFDKKLTIVGLGYKAQISGAQKMVFSLGFTHKIEYDLPAEVTVEIDKTGQSLLFRSADKFLLGHVCDIIRSFRPPEPYKGTGIIREGEIVKRKAGKSKASGG